MGSKRFPANIPMTNGALVCRVKRRPRWGMHAQYLECFEPPRPEVFPLTDHQRLHSNDLKEEG